MAQKHISQEPKAAGTKGGLILGSDRALLLNADLTSTADAAKAPMAVRAAKLHVSERPISPRVDASLDNIAEFDSTYLAGGSVLKASMLAISTSEAGRSLNY